MKYLFVIPPSNVTPQCHTSDSNSIEPDKGNTNKQKNQNRAGAAGAKTQNKHKDRRRQARFAENLLHQTSGR